MGATKRHVVEKHVRTDHGEVSLCSCGAVNLRFGPASARLTREQFAELARLVSAAQGKLGDAEVDGSAALVPSKDELN